MTIGIELTDADAQTVLDALRAAGAPTGPGTITARLDELLTRDRTLNSLAGIERAHLPVVSIASGDVTVEHGTVHVIDLDSALDHPASAPALVAGLPGDHPYRDEFRAFLAERMPFCATPGCGRYNPYGDWHDEDWLCSRHDPDHEPEDPVSEVELA